MLVHIGNLKHKVKQMQTLEDLKNALKIVFGQMDLSKASLSSDILEQVLDCELTSVDKESEAFKII